MFTHNVTSHFQHAIHKQTEIQETLKQNQTQNVAVVENDELSRNFISKLFKDYYKHKISFWNCLKWNQRHIIKVKHDIEEFI